MRNTERGILELLVVKHLFDSPGKNEMRAAQFVMANFNIFKRNPVAISTTKRFNHRLFCRPEARGAFIVRIFPVNFYIFLLGKDAL